MWNLLKVNNKDTRASYWRCSSVFFANFEPIANIILVSPLLILNK